MTISGPIDFNIIVSFSHQDIVIKIIYLNEFEYI